MRRSIPVPAAVVLCLAFLASSAFHANAQVVVKSSYLTNIDGNRFLVAEFEKKGSQRLSYQVSDNLVSWGIPGTGGRPTIVESIDSNDAQISHVRINRPIASGPRYFVRAVFQKTTKRRLDFDGDGKSDLVVVRNVGGGSNGAIDWIIGLSSGGTKTIGHGIAPDYFTPGDFDGDGITDAAVWRMTLKRFEIRLSTNGSLRLVALGETSDSPEVVADYDGDGIDDPAVYRSASGNGKFFYIGSRGNPGGVVTEISLNGGSGSPFANPGDYDGDGKMDGCIQSGTSRIFRRSSDGVVETATLGLGSDRVSSGDVDGDGRDDFMAIRGVAGNLAWFVLERDGGGTGTTPIVHGASASDFLAPADYDGDGKMDIAVWRPGVGFIIRRSTDGVTTTTPFGQNGDYAVADSYIY